MDYKEAKNYLENAQIDECEIFFKENNYQLECGYCELLKGNINEARKIFLSIRECDMRADWAYLFIQFMNNYIQFMPSYLQIRNFLEIDIALLINAGLSEAVENVIPTDEGALSESEKYEMLKNITIPDKEYTEWELSELEVTAQILREMGEKPEQYLELSKNIATAEGPGKTYFYEWAV